MDQGFQHQEAWEVVRENHLFPPEKPRNSEEAPPSPGFQVMSQFHQEMRQLDLSDLLKKP